MAISSSHTKAAVCINMMPSCQWQLELQRLNELFLCRPLAGCHGGPHFSAEWAPLSCCTPYAYGITSHEQHALKLLEVVKPAGHAAWPGPGSTVTHFTRPNWA
jgi:hypothetical protein